MIGYEFNFLRGGEYCLRELFRAWEQIGVIWLLEQLRNVSCW